MPLCESVVCRVQSLPLSVRTQLLHVAHKCPQFEGGARTDDCPVLSCVKLKLLRLKILVVWTTALRWCVSSHTNPEVTLNSALGVSVAWRHKMQVCPANTKSFPFTRHPSVIFLTVKHHGYRRCKKGVGKRPSWSEFIGWHLKCPIPLESGNCSGRQCICFKHERDW